MFGIFFPFKLLHTPPAVAARPRPSLAPSGRGLPLLADFVKIGPLPGCSRLGKKAQLY